MMKGLGVDRMWVGVLERSSNHESSVVFGGSLPAFAETMVSRTSATRDGINVLVSGIEMEGAVGTNG